MWQHWTNGVLGLALIVVAFMGLTGSTLLWTLAIGGAVIAIVGFWGASESTAGSRSSVVKHA